MLMFSLWLIVTYVEGYFEHTHTHPTLK
uniref:Uncharacterized protein n=1 Tax=Anguilla anguilla TaxID=7936 RepID=A0A0E9VBN8_ANGAN